MNSTGKFLTAEEIAAVRATLGAPLLIAIHCGMPLYDSPQQAVHKFALAKGLPEIDGYYGADLRTGEIFTV